MEEKRNDKVAGEEFILSANNQDRATAPQFTAPPPHVPRRGIDNMQRVSYELVNVIEVTQGDPATQKLLHVRAKDMLTGVTIDHLEVFKVSWDSSLMIAYSAAIVKLDLAQNKLEKFMELGYEMREPAIS